MVAALAEQAGLLVTPKEEEPLVQEFVSLEVASQKFCPLRAPSELESGPEVASSQVSLVGTPGSSPSL
jgi:hypothetical protein